MGLEIGKKMGLCLTGAGGDGVGAESDAGNGSKLAFNPSISLRLGL